MLASSVELSCRAYPSSIPDKSCQMLCMASGCPCASCLSTTRLIHALHLCIHSQWELLHWHIQELRVRSQRSRFASGNCGRKPQPLSHASLFATLEWRLAELAHARCFRRCCIWQPGSRRCMPAPVRDAVRGGHGVAASQPPSFVTLGASRLRGGVGGDAIDG